MPVPNDDADHTQPGPSTHAHAPNETHVDPLIVRPTVYYGEGTFDPPSSDDEQESLLGSGPDKDVPGSPGMAEMGGNSPGRRGSSAERHHHKSTSLRKLVIALVVLVGIAAAMGIIGAFTYSGASYRRVVGARKITMDHIFNGTFSAQGHHLNWVPEAGDGVYSESEGGYIRLVDLKTGTTENLVATRDVKDEHGNALWMGNWKVSPDMKYILIKVDYRKQWRWSSFGNYYVHNIAAKTTHPIIPPSHPSRTAFATWSPTGEAIAYVTDNDLYILPSAAPNTKPIRITSTGNASLFHGVPDWVYEEEIFSADSALWWSPNSHKLAFLSFDETLVEEFKFPIYNPTEDANAVIPYTTDVTMKYPKPGYHNPLVSVHVFDVGRYLEKVADLGGEEEVPAEEESLTLDWDGRRPVEDSVVLEVAWVGNGSLVVKEVNRNADDGNVLVFDLDDVDSFARPRGRVVRRLGREGEEGDSGWIDNEQTIYPLSSSSWSSSLDLDGDAYLDIVPTPEGYNHIALFSPATSSTPRFLTSGNWEVTGGIQSVDAKRGLVYFLAANPSSIERQLYSVPIPSLLSSSTEDDQEKDQEKDKAVEPTVMTDASKPAFYAVSFSPQAGFYILGYQGPGIPWQRVVQVDNPAFDHVLTLNERLLNHTLEYEAATVTHSTFLSDGYELNVKEIRPPKMDDSGRTKYPVLFRVYGGPHSQTVDLRFSRDWHEYVACGLEYIVVVVDGRGTGFKGRKLRNPVKGNLGYWETVDQVNAARAWAKKGYVDPKRIGIWGWSYGGFMSSKVVEANAGIHSLAMAVAPVTSWRLYDSIYTERYMNLPELNPGGYVNASISNVTGFHKVDYLLAHGSGDDNVHYANSAHLLDMFTKAQVRRFRFRMFTDSDHSISRRGAQREIYEYLTGFLVEKWGKGGRRRRV